MAITLDPIEFTLIISITPIKIAINAIARANSFMIARGSKRCGKNVSANEIGPPRTVRETIRVANKASDSIT